MVFLFGEIYRDVATVLDLVAERFEARFETGDAHGGGSHIDAAAGLAEVERDTDDTDAMM
jgi:hypothetical protein